MSLALVDSPYLIVRKRPATFAAAAAAAAAADESG